MRFSAYLFRIHIANPKNNETKKPIGQFERRECCGRWEAIHEVPMLHLLVNGVENAAVSALDRGLLYGDGLFETILVVNGTAPLWKLHSERLSLSCRRLQLPLPDIDLLKIEVEKVCENLPYAVVRITLTRGLGERGYALPPHARPTRIVTGFVAPVWPTEWYRDGIHVRWCNIRLGLNPTLAGIKHLNRLEQVLARAEWDDSEITEGLLCDSNDHVICATAANVFCVRQGRLFTPLVNQCGVAGVARAAVLQALPGCEQCQLMPKELLQADEIFLTSSIRGIVPVRQIEAQPFAVGEVTRTLQGLWRKRSLMLAE